jgi:hypothetical protein
MKENVKIMKRAKGYIQPIRQRRSMMLSMATMMSAMSKHPVILYVDGEAIDDVDNIRKKGGKKMREKCQMLGLVFYIMYSQPSINGEGSLDIVGTIRILPYLVDISLLGRSIWRRVFDIQRRIFSSIFPGIYLAIIFS